MSIHDVSKTQDRANPSPNSHDNLAGLQPAHGTSSTIFTREPVTRVLSTIVPPGKGGGTATVNNGASPLNNRLVPPSQPLAYGQAQVGVSSAPISWVTIPHNLGFTPRVDAYFLNAEIEINDGTIITNNGAIPLPTFTALDIGGSVSGGLTFQTWYQAVADSENLYLICYNATGFAAGIDVTYYLYQQQL